MDSNKYNVLYVDDERDNLDVFESTFWRDYNLHLATSAKEGIDILKDSNIHLIITDQRMPTMTGIEFLEKVHEKYPDPPRIVLTGYSDLDTVIEAVNRGKIFHYATKPWKKEDLQKTIEKALENFRLREENRLLLQRLQISNHKLEDLNKGLETKVKERTAELQEKNEALSETLYQLKNAQVHLIQSEKMASIGMLSYSLGHEINTPINTIKGGLEVIRDMVDQDDLVKKKKDLAYLVENMLEGADRTVEIIRSLRFFVGSNSDHFQKVDVHDGLNATLLLLGSPIQQASIKITTYYDSKMKPIYCLPGPLNQVFLNLLVNAIDAIEESQGSGEIEIRTDQNDDDVKVMIRDNGIGMSANVMENMFETFYSTKDTGKGSGLGMSISRDIIDKHGGKIKVQSNIGEGTTITVTLPKLNPKGKAID